jgi:hypothetical protein
VVSEPSWQDASPSSWWPAWFPDRTVYTNSSYVFDIGALILAIVFIVLLLSKFRRARGLDRLVIMPVFVAAIVSAIAAGTVVTGLLFSAPGDTLFTIESTAELFVPLAFLMSVVQRRMARGRVAALTVQLAGQDAPKPVRDALRRALHDPRLNICYWVPASGSYVDSTGQPVDPGQLGPGQLAIPITGSDGKTPLAVLFADRSTARDRPLTTAGSRQSSPGFGPTVTATHLASPAPADLVAIWVSTSLGTPASARALVGGGREPGSGQDRWPARPGRRTPPPPRRRGAGCPRARSAGRNG